jgi:hypothetical protein
MTAPNDVSEARSRALRIVAAYASVRRLSDAEFCRLVNDLTLKLDGLGGKLPDGRRR